MKIVFDTKEQMERFLEKFENSLSDIIIDYCNTVAGRCSDYNGCVDCLRKNIDITYVKNCRECAKDSSCTDAYYRGDLVNKVIKCKPKAK